MFLFKLILLLIMTLPSIINSNILDSKSRLHDITQPSRILPKLDFNLKLKLNQSQTQKNV